MRRKPPVPYDTSAASLPPVRASLRASGAQHARHPQGRPHLSPEIQRIRRHPLPPTAWRRRTTPAMHTPRGPTSRGCRQRAERRRTEEPCSPWALPARSSSRTASPHAQGSTSPCQMPRQFTTRTSGISGATPSGWSRSRGMTHHAHSHDFSLPATGVSEGL